jgi:bifunctional DNA-binding transcriptional regulator/antitoxin component of YhaV-PrlF toxin-antitoxin module
MAKGFRAGFFTWWWRGQPILECKANLPYIAPIEEAGAMTILTVTSKGQVTLRRDLLQHLGVGPGEKIEIDKLPDGRIEVRAARPGASISAVFGLLKRGGAAALSVEEMNDIAAAGWAGRKTDPGNR